MNLNFEDFYQFSYEPKHKDAIIVYGNLDKNIIAELSSIRKITNIFKNVDFFMSSDKHIDSDISSVINVAPDSIYTFFNNTDNIYDHLKFLREILFNLNSYYDRYIVIKLPVKISDIRLELLTHLDMLDTSEAILSESGFSTDKIHSVEAKDDILIVKGACTFDNISAFSLYDFDNNEFSKNKEMKNALIGESKFLWYLNRIGIKLKYSKYFS